MGKAEKLFMQYAAECGMDEDTQNAAMWSKHGVIDFAEWIIDQNSGKIESIQDFLLVITTSLLEANADYINISQKMVIKGNQVSISGKIKIKDITPISAP